MKTRKVVIDDRYGEEYQGEYVFRKWTWGEKNRVTAKHTKFDPMTGRPSEINWVAINEEMLLATLKKAPFEVTLEALRNLDPDLGDYLLSVTNEVNSVGPGETKNS